MPSRHRRKNQERKLRRITQAERESKDPNLKLQQLSIEVQDNAASVPKYGDTVVDSRTEASLPLNSTDSVTSANVDDSKVQRTSNHSTVSADLFSNKILEKEGEAYPFMRDSLLYSESPCKLREEKNWATAMYERPYVHVKGKQLVIGKPVYCNREENHSESGSVMDSMLDFSVQLKLSSDKFCIEQQDLINDQYSYEDWQIGHSIDFLAGGMKANTGSISDELSGKGSAREARLVSASVLHTAPYESAEQSGFIQNGDERLIIGKSIPDKHGKQSLCSLTIARSDTSERQNEAVGQIHESSNPGEVSSLTRRRLFPVESRTVDYDVQENRYGDTVMFSLKRKSIRKMQGESSCTNSDAECIFVSPVHKKVMLVMQNESKPSGTGGLDQNKCNAQSADHQGTRSTVFLLKRKHKIEGSPKRKSFFVSPFKKKRKLANRRPSNQFPRVAKSGLVATDPNNTVAQRRRNSISMHSKFLRKRVKRRRLYDKRRRIALKCKPQQLFSDQECVNLTSSEDRISTSAAHAANHSRKRNGPVHNKRKKNSVILKDRQARKSFPIPQRFRKRPKSNTSATFKLTLNPTFKKLNVYSNNKLKKNVFQLRESEGKLRIKVLRSLKGSMSCRSLKARSLVKWSLVARRRLIAEFQKTYKSLAAKCEDWVNTAEQYPSSAEKCEAMLGIPQHTHTTEPYFCESIYKELKLKCPGLKAKEKGQVSFPEICISEDGNAMNVFPTSENASVWDCGLLCKTDDRTCVRKVGKIFRKLKQVTLSRPMVGFLRNMNNCKGSCRLSQKRGHSAVCRLSDGNGAPLVVLQNLQPHYPRLRKVVRSLNSLKRLLYEIDGIDFALYDVNLEKLEVIAEKAKLAGGEFTVGDVSYTEEDAIFAKYKDSFKALDKRMSDLPVNYCFSCERLLFRRDLVQRSRMRCIPRSEWWSKVLNAKKEKGVCVDFICHFCLLKIRNGELPSISTLNKMEVPEVPYVIRILNSFEKVFIQRAKAFQVVIRAGTVSGKKIPASHLNMKVKGRTFHMPLPLEQTIKRILRDEQAVMPNQELYFLVRGLPTNQKKVWESLVDFSVILKALQWLKTHNFLYEHIEIPKNAEEFIKSLEDIDFDDPANPPAPNDSSKNRNRVRSDEDENVDDSDEDRDSDDSHASRNTNDSDEGHNSDDSHARQNPNDSDEGHNSDDSLARQNPDDSERSRSSADDPNDLDESLNADNLPKNHNPDGPPSSNSSNFSYDPLEPTSPTARELYGLLKGGCTAPENDCESDEPGDEAFLNGFMAQSESEESCTPLNADGYDQDKAELVDDTSDIDPHPSAGESDSNASNPQTRRNAPTLDEIAALVTQRNKDDAYYDGFTIIPVYDKRENKEAAELFQMLRVEGENLDTRAPYLDAQCFPDLYPDGKNCFNEDREVALQFAEFVKAKLMSRHPQFRLNIQYLFFLMHQLTTRQIAAGVYQTLNVTRSKRTAADFLANLGKENLEQDMSSVFRRVRNTEAYWSRPRSQIYRMIDNYGPATFFFTYSPTLYDDPELDSYLREVNGQLTKGKSTSQLIADDPVSVSRFCDQKLHGILDFLTVSENGPLGKVEHFAVRREYQSRGTQHFHFLLWVKDAPVLGISSGEEIAEFIQKHITCSIPDKKTFPELYKKVMSYQIHKDNAYCTRTVQTKSGKLPVCRFGFPRPVTDKLVLRDVPTSIAGRRNLRAQTRLYDLPRKDTEVRVNDYNPAILLAVGYGNMDIQFVGEKSGIVGRYITKYVSKPEKSNMGDVFDDIYSTKNQYQKLWSIASRGTSNRECHALEAADAALGIPLFMTDRDTVFRWIDVGMVRSRKLKTPDQIKKIAKEDPTSTEYFCNSVVDTHYPNRPDEMENMCLYDFVRDYDIVKTKPTRVDAVFFKYPGFGYLRKSSRPRLVNHYHFDVKQKPEQYFYSLLLLFKPWRTVDDLKGDHENFTKAFEAEKDSLHDAMQYHEKRTVLDAAREEIMRLADEQSKEFEKEMKNGEFKVQEDPHGFKAAEAEEAMKEFREVAGNIDAEDLTSLESQLNEDQLRVYEYVKSALDKKDTPMRHFVSGVGGTGKSFLIKTIAKYVREKLKKDVAITSPTGISSFAISGQTLHRLLQLPVQHGKDLKYSRLPDTVLQILRLALKGAILLIIDEISMVSSLMLMFIHLRLSEVFDSFDKENAFFGNLNILVLGDLLQLPPVAASSPFQNLTDAEITKHFESMSGFNLWQNLFTYDELRINMRQKSDPSFCQLLANVRLGICSEKDVRTLLQCKLEFKEKTPDARTKELAKRILDDDRNPVCLLPTRNMCKRLNDAVLDLLPGKKIVLLAEDSVDSRQSDKSRAKKKLQKLENDCSRTAGLEKTITVKEGARVMLVRNIDVTAGYVNGAFGTIKSATTDSDGSTTKLVLQMKDSVLELTPITVKFEIMPGIFVHRKQFPICLSYGVTIHKSQGLSLDCCYVDVGTATFAKGQTYVALSRVRTLAGLVIININPLKIQALDVALKEYERLRLMTDHLKSIAKEFCFVQRDNIAIVDDVWAPPRQETANVVDKTPPIKVKKPSSLVPAFENDDRKSCYANATLQCLLSYEPLRSALRRSEGNSALKELAEMYAKTRTQEILSASSVRAAASTAFVSFQNSKMEDPVVFFLELANDNALRAMTTFTEDLEKKCGSCKTVTTVGSESHCMLQMPTDHKTVSAFLSERSSWSKSTDSLCPKCHVQGNVMQRSLIRNPSNLFVVRILLWNASADGKGRMVKNTSYQMTALPTTNLAIGECRYGLHAVTFHSGKGTIDCHHTAIIRSAKNNILADDSNISECRWPRGSRGAYMLFFSKVDKPQKSNKKAPPKESCVPPSASKVTGAPCKRAGVTASKTKGPPCKMRDAAASKQLDANVSSTYGAKEPNAVSRTNAKSSVQQRTAAAALAQLLPGFVNMDNSCYANASLQCLLHYEPVRTALSDSANDTALKRLAFDYPIAARERRLLSAYDVRVEADASFAAPEPQDARLFLNFLINGSDALCEKTHFFEVHEKKCALCENVQSTTSDRCYVLPLSTLDNHKSITELLDGFSSYETILDYKCVNPTCLQKTSAHARTLVRYPSELLIVHILLFDRNHEKNVDFRMTTNQIITVDECQYKLLGAVFHHGDRKINRKRYNAHYTAVLCHEEQFIRADDFRPATMCKWPEGSKDAYLLFYRRL